MSLQKLHDDLVAQADAKKAITLNAQVITGAGLTPPANLDNLIAKALSIPSGQSLTIATSRDQIGPVAGDRLSVTGKLALFSDKTQRTVKVDFTAAGTALNFILTVTLDGGWQFSSSFIYMGGKLFQNLPIDPSIKPPNFVFSTSLVTKYQWGPRAQDNVTLQPGLNFAGYLTVTKLLGKIAPLLPSAPSGSYLLSGTLDPSKITPKGQTPVGLFPGLDLSALFATASYNLDFLTISNPGIEIDLIDVGTLKDPKPTPQVAFAVGLDAGIGSPVTFRAGIPVNGGLMSLTVDPPAGGAILTAAQLFKLMAGQTWYTSVPPQVIGFLSHFQFQSFSAWVRLGPKPQIGRVSCRVGTGPIQWKLFDVLQINELTLDWSVTSPLTAPESSATLSAEFMFFPTVFTSPFFVTITSDLTVSGRYPGTVELKDVVSGLTGGAVSIPSWFQLSFSDIAVIVNPSQRSYSLRLGAELTLDLFNNGKFGIEDVTFSFNAVKASDTSPYAYSSSFNGLLALGPITLLVSADYQDNQWTLTAATPFGTELSLQVLINSIFESVDLPTDMFKLDLSVSDLVLTALIGTGQSPARNYSFQGRFRWEFSLFNNQVKADAQVRLNYDSTAANPFTGSIAATTTLDFFGVGATFTLGYAVANDPVTKQPNKTLSLSWEGLTAAWVSGSNQNKITFTVGDGWSLGRIIGSLVHLIDPSLSPELPSPWNLLNEVSLKGLQVTFDLNTKQVTVSYPVSVKLFFLNITRIDITAANGEVNINLVGTYLDNKPIPSWNAVKDDPPAVPGGGDSAFDLRLLALGQRITIGDLSGVNSVSDAVDRLVTFTAPKPDSTTLPVKAKPGPKEPAFSANSNWLVGTHFLAASNMLELKAIFNDPTIYGLYIGLSGDKAKIFAGLKFEILYKRISDSVGVYKIVLQLPTAMRTLQFGSVTITLPVVKIDIYTNGNFLIDFGFPARMDFTNSFAIQVFPFTGAAGFYFGILDGSTSTQVPKATCGTFKPVVVFGLGLSIGLGKSFTAGILSAEISISIVGIIEGVIASWHAYDSQALLTDGSDTRALATSGNQDVSNQYYYWIQGTLGIVGKISGSVDFAIVKAEVYIEVRAFIQATFEAYRSTLVYLEAGVSISLKIRINLGLFKVTISLSFSAKITQQFVLGQDRINEAPWSCGRQALRSAAPKMMAAAALDSEMLAPAGAPAFSLFLAPATPPERIKITFYLMPHLTITGEDIASATDQSAAYSMMFYLDSPPPNQTGPDPGTTDFEKLAEELFIWAAANFGGQTATTTRAAASAEAISAARLTAALNYLSDNARSTPIPYDRLTEFLGATFDITISQPASSADPNVTVFPMIPDLELVIPPYKGSAPVDIWFDDWTIADDSYLSSLADFISKLNAQFLTDLERRDSASAGRPDTIGPPPKQSLARFIFLDYFGIVARFMIQEALDALQSFSWPIDSTSKLSDIVTQVNGIGDTTGHNELTIAAAGRANQNHPLTGGTQFNISGVSYQIPPGKSLQNVADLFKVNAGDIAVANQDNKNLLVVGMSVTIGTGQHNVDPGDDIATMAAKFSLAPGAFGTAIAGISGLFVPLAPLKIPPVPHTVSASETLSAVAAQYGVAVESLASDVASVAGVFASDPAHSSLLLPGLSFMTADRIITDLRNHNAVQHLSGMTARYLLHGLRPFTNGLDLNPDSGCTGSDCALYRLTGQFVALPSLKDYDPAKDAYSITLQKHGTVDWLNFAGSDPAKYTITLDATAAGQVNSLVGVATNRGLLAPVTAAGALGLLQERPANFTFGSHIILQSPESISLPNGSQGSQVVPSPVVWNFSSGLISAVAPQKDLLPKFKIQIGTQSVPGRALQFRDASYFGWGGLIRFRIKKIPVAPGSAEVLSNTYEVVGADEVGINLLERLLGNISPGNTNVINSLQLFYQASQSGSQATGLQTDGMSNLTTFVVQANLSTETNPPPRFAALMSKLGAAPPPRGILNSRYEFLARLWAASIIRSGGYYLYYTLPNGAGLPDVIFGPDNIATLNLLIIYSETNGLVTNYMNCAVTGESIDASSSVVCGESQPRTASVNTGASESLSDIAGRYNATVIDIATANQDKAVNPLATLLVSNIFYQIRPGQTLAQIAAIYGIQNLDDIKNANRGLQIDWNNLPAQVVIRIPDVQLKPSAASGNTLSKIAVYSSVSVASLAWSNRDVKGLFPSNPPLTFNDQIVTKTASVPQGNVGLQLVRQNPGDNLDDPTVYLEQQFNLLAYAISDNQFFRASTDALGLPAGPADQLDPDDLASADRHPAANASGSDPWNYTQVFPAYRYAKSPSSGVGNGAGPSAAANPYGGTGGVVQIELHWQDFFGNRTLSPFENQGPGTTYPLNRVPVPFGISDQVLGLNRWTSTRFDYYFDTVASGTQIFIDLTFDTSRYDPNLNPPPQFPGDLPGWQKNALADRQTYATVYYQLNHVKADGKPSLTVSLATTIDGSQDHPITGHPLDSVKSFVTEAFVYLDNLLNNKPATAPANVTIQLPAAARSDASMFPLGASLTMRRDLSLITDEFKDSTPVSTAVTALGPKLMPRESNPSDPTLTVDWFVDKFESAFKTASHSLKLANGVSREDIGENGSDALWAVRLGSSNTDFLYFAIDSPAMFFALPPLSTRLISRPGIPLYSYTRDGGLVGPDQSFNFSGIDLDEWASTTLEAIDTLLAPQFATPAFIIDQLGKTSYLQDILGVKSDLAGAVAGKITNLLDDPPLDPIKNKPNFDHATELLRQQLLIKLGNAYTIDAVVQYDVQVKSNYQTAAGAEPPRLYGSPIVTSAGQAGDSQTDEYTISPFKFGLGDGTSYLTYAFSAKNARNQKRFSFDLVYQPTNVEHEIGSVPGIKNYQASSWLQFIRPPAPIPVTAGHTTDIEIPVILRAYPLSPAMVAQRALQPAGSSSPEITLQQAKQWTFEYEYAQQHVAQDTINSSVIFNFAEHPALRAMAVQADLFTRLAQFNWVYSEILATFEQVFPKISLSSDIEGADFKAAQKALSAFYTLINGMDEAWTAWTPPPPNQPAPGMIEGTNPTFSFTIDEDHYWKNPDWLEVIVSSDQALLPNQTAPGVVFSGYTAQPAEPNPNNPPPKKAVRQAVFYKNAKGEPLLWDDAFKMPDRSVDFAGLDVIQYENGWASVSITRNQGLIENNPTRSQFVYGTPVVQFANSLTPILTTDSDVDIAKIPTGTAQLRPLWQHLQQLFQTFLQDSPAQTATIKLECSYSFAISDSDAVPKVVLPVLLVSPFAFRIPADWSPAGGTCPAVPPDDSAFICRLAYAMLKWFDDSKVSTRGGEFRIDLSAFARLTANPLPLVRVTQLTIGTSFIQELNK